MTVTLIRAVHPYRLIAAGCRHHGVLDPLQEISTVTGVCTAW